MINYSSLGLAELSVGLITIYLVPLLFQIAINPSCLFEYPRSDKAQEVTEARGSRAIGIFAIVLAVINFLFSGNAELAPEEWLTLTTTLLSAGFLMIAFTVEMVSTLYLILFRIQESAIEFAGLLLFLGLYFFIKSKSPPGDLTFIIGSLIALSWIIWLMSNIHYLGITQRREWQAYPESRQGFLAKSIKYKIKSFYEIVIQNIIPDSN